MKKSIQRYFTKNPKFLVYLFSLLTFLLLFFLMQTKSEKKSSYPNSKESPLDTFIPKGFVLVPIEVENRRSLDSALGQYGVVNLYARKSADSSFYIRVAKGVQILKSPYEPHEFAVLLPEDKAQLILEIRSAFKVAIQNPKVNQMSFKTKTIRNQKKKRKIYIEF